MTHHTDGEERGPAFVQGFRAATKDAITWLHERAEEMNDPHARQVLNVAAFNLGNDAKDPRYHNRMRARQKKRAKELGLWPHQPVEAAPHGKQTKQKTKDDAQGA